MPDTVTQLGYTLLELKAVTTFTIQDYRTNPPYTRYRSRFAPAVHLGLRQCGRELLLRSGSLRVRSRFGHQSGGPSQTQLWLDSVAALFEYGVQNR
jgi:hypothetical protein